MNTRKPNYTSKELDMVSLAQHKTRLLVATLLVLGAACRDKWSVPHAAGKALSANRPECPVKWDTVPLFGVGNVINEGSGRAIAQQGNGGIGTPGANGPAVSGPITDIPEFHDCQKFILIDSAGVRSYGPLFAIFAAFKLDSVVDSLRLDNVVWQSSDPTVATVDPTGRVTGVKAGTVTIVGSSVQHPSIKAMVAVVVLPVPPGPPLPPSVGSIYVAPGGGATGNLHVGQTLQLLTVMGQPTTSTLPVAEIYTYGGGDTRLGIGPNFSCLYLYFDAQGAMQAQIIPMPQLGTAWDACVKASPGTFTASNLAVIRTSGGPASDYPATARWDWDPQNNQQSIGIKCGAGWCQIGTKGPTGKPFTASAGYPVSDKVSTNEARVIGVKGWYDEQFLAITPPGGAAIPTTMKGTVIPDPALSTYTRKDYESHSWVPVAYFALDAGTASHDQLMYYKNKLNLDVVPVAAPLSSMNQIALCFGSRKDCGVPLPQPGTTGCQPETIGPFSIPQMWTRIISAVAHDTTYRCNTRRSMPMPNGVTIPATARLRWLADDETVWTMCTQGCCEIEVFK